MAVVGLPAAFRTIAAMTLRYRGIALLVAALLASPARPQTFDTAAWNVPTEPFRIVGNVYFVGTTELGVYLVTSKEGHVLVDGGLPEGAPHIEASIRKLGFEPADIRHLVTTQAHFDHVGSLAHFKKISGVRVSVMAGDDDVVASGGRTDDLFGSACERCRFPEVAVDRVLKDGDTISLGGVTLTARHSPGHTRGSTTWLTTAEDGGRRYSVVFSASTTINPGTRLVDRPSYPGIADDFAKTFRLLESLTPDVFLASHTVFFDMAAKRERLGKGGRTHPFVDPEGFRAHVAAKKKVFEEQVAAERAGQKKG